MHRFSVEHCGVAGKKYIEYITKNYVGTPKLKEIYNDILRQLEDGREDNISSHISTKSWTIVAKTILQKAIEDEDVKQKVLDLRDQLGNKLSADSTKMRKAVEICEELYIEMIDVSGSVDLDLVRAFLRMLKPLLKESKLRVGCFNEKYWGIKALQYRYENV